MQMRVRIRIKEWKCVPKNSKKPRKPAKPKPPQMSSPDETATEELFLLFVILLLFVLFVLLPLKRHDNKHLTSLTAGSNPVTFALLRAASAKKRMKATLQIHPDEIRQMSSHNLQSSRNS